MFSVGNGTFQLEIYDCYTIPNEADVISVRISKSKKNTTACFRSSGKQAIRRIESVSDARSVTHKDGIFSVDLESDQEFLFLNIYFDAKTFEKSVQSNGFIEVYFECSANAAIGKYEKIAFSCALSEIRDKES